MTENELREFYELCQEYRHVSVHHLADVRNAYDALTDFVNRLSSERYLKGRKEMYECLNQKKGDPEVPEQEPEQEIVTTNFCLVGTFGNNIVMLNPPDKKTRMSSAEALSLAAWLVTMSGKSSDDFMKVLKAVQNC